MLADPDIQDRFVSDVLRNANVRTILSRWDHLALPDGWLVAGCLFQTVWNVLSKRAPEADIKDYDFFYFDSADLGERAEQSVQARVAALLEDLGVTVEIKNQARVHLWYEEHFGYPYPVLQDAREGIARFLVPATSVGMRPGREGWEVYAPHGLESLYAGILTPNPLTDHRPLFMAKADSYRERWPWLQIRDAELPLSTAAATTTPPHRPSA
jgi:hypothetical protein